MGAVEAVMKTHTSLLPHIKTCIEQGTIIDNGQLIGLYLLARLLERELEKCLHLVSALPMADMDSYFGRFSIIIGALLLFSFVDNKSKRPATGGIGTMLTQVSHYFPLY